MEKLGTKIVVSELSDEVAKARAYAVIAHQGQLYGGKDYVEGHLDVVASILAPYGDTAMVEGYLHDVVEDTRKEKTEAESARLLADISLNFGADVSRHVGYTTDIDAHNRKERKRLTNEKLAAVTEDLPLVVKAADRLGNLRECVATGNAGLFKMYRNEHAAFRSAVYRSGLAEEIWHEIETIIVGD